jgi:hypothetical protein
MGNTWVQRKTRDFTLQRPMAKNPFLLLFFFSFGLHHLSHGLLFHSVVLSLSICLLSACVCEREMGLQCAGEKRGRKEKENRKERKGVGELLRA